MSFLVNTRKKALASNWKSGIASRVKEAESDLLWMNDTLKKAEEWVSKIEAQGFTAFHSGVGSGSGWRSLSVSFDKNDKKMRSNNPTLTFGSDGKIQFWGKPTAGSGVSVKSAEDWIKAAEEYVNKEGS